MKNYIRKNKGITLVALVVTIIILLILAGISIATLTGSGLFENARLAGQKSKEAQEKEEGILADYENKIGEYVNSNRESEELKEFKKIIAKAITERGIDTSEDADATTMANNIKSINEQEIEYPYFWGSVNTSNAMFELTKIRNKTIYIESVSTNYIKKASDPGNGDFWTNLYNTSGYTEIDVEKLIRDYSIDIEAYPYLIFNSVDYKGFNFVYAK